MNYQNYKMDGDAYNLLYKRYLKRPPSELLELAGMKNGDIIWDICAGSNCIVTKEAIKQGAKKVIAIDPNVSMNKNQHNIMPLKVSIEEFLFNFYVKTYELECPDIIICRQGVNYWANKDTISQLSSYMAKDSIFVFNTFDNKPSIKPSIKQYEINGRLYVEVWYLTDDDMVQHLQAVEGLEPHLTYFRWISPDEYDVILKPYFDIRIYRDKKSVIYICKKK